jgi:hypothetical protein
MDFDKGTVEFFKNGISQGIAFDNLLGRCHVAASLTAADSTLSIHHWDLRSSDEKEVGVGGWDIEKKSQFLESPAGTHPSPQPSILLLHLLSAPLS